MRCIHICLLFLVPAVFSSAARAQVPGAGDFQPDPTSVERYGPAYRFPQAGWIVLHIEGQPYERGYQHGRLLAPEIAGYLRCFAAMLGPKAQTEAWQNTRRLVNALFVRRFEKEFLEEMRGIADGATAAGARFDNRPIDLVDIVGLNVWPEIETLDSALEATPTGLEGIRFPHQQPRAKPAPRPEHCSAFAATGPATADGKIVFGHITMFSLYAANFYNVWIDIKPAKGHRVLMCAYPGAMQSGMDYYLNDAGLLIAETTIGQTRFDIRGQTEASRIRQAIQYAGTIDQAVEILKKDNNGLYTNEWLLGDINTSEIALFELGTHKSKLHRSSKNEWIGGTEGFYWGCNNTKDLELRLETVASVAGRPANVVFHPSERDIAWQKLYREHKGKIDVGFGKLAFTTPPLAAHPSLDAKFTTSDLAKQLKSYALFGPPLGRTWEPTFEQRKQFPEIKPLVSNPWTILHANAPAKSDSKRLKVAVDLHESSTAKVAVNENRPILLNVPAWHGTILPQSDGDIWLAAAFAEYERYVAKEKAMRAEHDGELTEANRDELAVDLFGWQTAYRSAARKIKDVPLTEIKADWTSDDWYQLASGKGVLVLHQLRGLVGDPAFEDAMDSFGRENAGKKVTTAQFKAHMEKKTAKQLDGFFTYMVDGTRLPTLNLRDVTCMGPGAYMLGGLVRGRIFLDDPGCPISHVDLTVETDNGELKKQIELTNATTEFQIDLKFKRPQRITLNRDGAVVHADGPAFTIQSYHSEQPQTLIVYGTTDEPPTNREAAEGLQKAIRANWQNITIPIRSDKDITEAELKSHHLLLIGRPDSNVLVERFRKNLPIPFGSRSFVVRGKTYAHPGSAVVAAAENPLNRRFSIVVLAGLSAESTVFAPGKFVQRRQRPAEVLVLPNEGAAQALVMPRHFVELNQK